MISGEVRKPSFLKRKTPVDTIENTKFGKNNYVK